VNGLPDRQGNNTPFPDGEFYDLEAPDTLDLAGHAAHAINCLVGMVKPEQNHEALWSIQLAPVTARDHGHEWFGSSPQALEPLTLMRTITGSTYGLDKEMGLLGALIDRIGEDGLVYNLPFTPDAYWRYEAGTGCRVAQARPDDEVCSICANSFLAIALMERYERDGDPFMLATATRLIRALIRIAVHKEDYAYYPSTPRERFEFSYYKKAGWPDTSEARSELDNQEGTVASYIGLIIRALARFYALTGDSDAISLASRLVKYVLKPQFWLGNVERWSGSGQSENVWEGHGGAQRKPAALFKGHLSGIALTLEALIDYAAQVNDAYVKEFVRQGYEFYRNMGIARIGMWGENIANSYLAGIAIKLSDSGAGDYWDDVDQYVRNQVVEDQLTDVSALKELCSRNGLSSSDDRYRYGRFVRLLLDDASGGERRSSEHPAREPSHTRDLMQRLCEHASKHERHDALTDADREALARYTNGEIGESQVLRAICDHHGFDYGNEEYNLERFIGGLTHYNNIDKQGTLDPTSNFAQIACPYHEPIYFIWEGITRFNNGMAESL